MIGSLDAVTGRRVSRETLDDLRRYSELVRSEASHQNLIAASTTEVIWQRHIVDSAQLLRFAPEKRRRWSDVGSGAGLPGMVLALLDRKIEMRLVEPRRLRAAFLSHLVEELRLSCVQVCSSKVEATTGKSDVITARAVAPLDKLLGITAHLAHRDTLWVLPKGRNAKSELAEAERNWHYDVRAEQSVTDPEASILLLSNVRAKRKS